MLARLTQWVSPALLCLMLAVGVQAGQKVDVYYAEVLVKNASESERNRAAQATLGEVIVRVSGQTSALQHPLVSAAIPKAQNYLFGFSYQASSEKLVRDGKTFSAVKLQLNYSAQAIEQLLREAQLPLWPATRPKLLVWLVAQDQTGFHLVPELSDGAALRAQGRLRGLPLVRPALDLEDSLSLNADDLWRLSLDKIKAASRRYQADAILVGRYVPTDMNSVFPPLLTAQEQELIAAAPLAVESAQPSSADTASVVGESEVPAQPLGPWQSEWLLVSGDQTHQFVNEAPSVSALFEAAVDYSADYFANVYAIKPSAAGPQTLAIKIANITSFAAFKQVQAYMAELALVADVQLLRVNSEGLWLSLTIDGDIKLLVETLSLGKRLAPMVTESLDVLKTQTVVASGSTADYIPAQAPDIAAVEASINAELAREFGLEPGTGLKPAAAQNDSALVNAADAAQAYVPPQAGTAKDPLLYIWQK